MQNPLNIYIASSFRNIHAVHLLRDRLQSQGYTVLDFTKFAPPLPDAMKSEDRRVAIDHDERGIIFNFCTSACGQADLVIYVGASGQDSACEVGIAWAAGVPVFGIAGVLEKPGTILARAVTSWFMDIDALLQGVKMFAEEGNALCNDGSDDNNDDVSTIRI